MKNQVEKLIDEKTKRALVLDELFDLRLYQRFRKIAKNDLARILDELIEVETRHVKYWQDMFSLENLSTLNTARKLKLELFSLVCSALGERSIFFALEAIEVSGIRKYLRLWEDHKDTAFGEGLREILTDEFEHEDKIIRSASKKKIAANKIRNAFLGFNDGLVEVLGAIAGFYVAFNDSITVVIAGLTVAIAGSISMAAGVFVSESSEHEIEDLERGKKLFLGKHTTDHGHNQVIKLSAIVGIAYIIGALVPLIPTLFGSRSILISAAGSAAMIIIVSYILSFISGMDIKKRILMNLGIIIAAVVITSSIGLLIKNVLGISV